MNHQFNNDMIYARQSMINDLVRKGIYSSSLLHIMSEMPRHFFVSEALKYRAYDDTSLPIGFGQTVSKPSVIAKMIQSINLSGEERVLEIGTGSGYQSALLSSLAKEVVSLERIKELYLRARNLLFEFKISNVKLIHSDDFNEARDFFDAIIVAAGAEILPNDLLKKLVPGGILVIPVGNSSGHLIKKFIKKSDDLFVEENIGTATFVPYIVGEGA